MRVGDVSTFERTMAYMAKAAKVVEEADDGEPIDKGER